MIVLYVLLAATLLARAAGLVWEPLAAWQTAVRAGFAVMFVFTGVAHFTRQRADLVRMVPPGLPGADDLVTLTGIAELAGAAGLVLPATARYAAIGLIALLVAMFPANIYAARTAHTIGGRPHTPLPLRTLLQVFWIGGLWWSARVVALVVIASGAGRLHAQEAQTGIARVAWLQGCWETVTPQRAIEEQWMAPRGTSMLMMGRTVRGTELVDYELVILREDGERLAYEAHPAGQPSATFRSIEISASRVVFENREHDFPQRVGYERNPDGGLAAWVEGTDKGTPKHIDFVYRRTRCGA